MRIDTSSAAEASRIFVTLNDKEIQLVAYQTNQTENPARNDAVARISNDEPRDTKAKVNKVEQDTLSEAKEEALAAAEERVV